MDYSKMSDFEINTAVFETLHGGSPDYREGDGGAMVLISYEGDVVGGDAVEVEVERGLFNPCNDPADAWPIIVENEISIMWMTVEQQWCSSALGELEEGCWEWSYCPDHYFGDSNPLRAAMIVFLMMQESANVQANSTGPDIR